MKTIYNALDEMEAQLLVDQLKFHGISGHVVGSHLSGAIGELPAQGLIRVQVADGDAERGEIIVSTWRDTMNSDSGSSESTTDSAVPTEIPARSSNSSGLLMLAAGVAIGACTAFVLLHIPDEDVVDFDKDGVVDETYQWEGDALRSVIADRNADGNPDWRSLLSRQNDGRGTVLLDDDFDGRDERRNELRKGFVLISELDRDGDGFHEVKEAFRHGALEERMYLAPPSGDVIKREYFEHGVLHRSEADLNRDGTNETFWTFDALGEPGRAEGSAP